MRKLAWIALFVMAAFYFWPGQEVRKKKYAEAQSAVDQVSLVSSAAGKGKARAESSGAAENRASEEAEAATAAPEASALPMVVLPAQGSGDSGYFPGASVVASTEELSDEEGEVRVVKTLETDLSERFVRLVETYRKEGEDRVLERQEAMVANQLLLRKPDGAAEDEFLAGLQQAGALEVKVVGGGYLATFESRPGEPNALNLFRERVREVLGTSVVVEPNYIRQLI